MHTPCSSSCMVVGWMVGSHTLLSFFVFLFLNFLHLFNSRGEAFHRLLPCRMVTPDGNGRKYACVHGGEGPLSLQMEARRQLQAGRLHLATPPFPPPLSHTSPWGLAASENHGYNGGMGLEAPPKQPANPLRSARLWEGGLNLGVTGQDRSPRQ